MDMMYCLYAMMIVSLGWLKVVPVSALSAFSLGLHLVTMLLTCGANDMEGGTRGYELVRLPANREVWSSIHGAAKEFGSFFSSVHTHPVHQAV